MVDSRDLPAESWEEEVDYHKANVCSLPRAARASSNQSRSSSREVPVAAESESWKRACHRKYFTKRCQLASCQCRHDLSTSEIQQFMDWAQNESIHVVDSSGSECGSPLSASAETPAKSSTSSSVLELSGGHLREVNNGSPGGGVNTIAREGTEKAKQEQGTGSATSSRPRLGGAEVVSSWVDMADDDEEEDEEGEAADAPAPSKGSEAHASGNCRPCILVTNAVGCKDGEDCLFCHYDHSGSPKRQKKLRPCKSKRERYRKLLDRLAPSAEQNSESLDAKPKQPPPYLEPQVKHAPKAAPPRNADREKQSNVSL